MKSQKWKVSSHCRDGKLLFNHLFKRYAPKLSLSGSYLAKPRFLLNSSFFFSLYARNRTHSTSNSIVRGWAYLLSLAHFSLSLTLRKIPRIVFYRHRLLTLIVRSSYPTQIVWYFVRSPFPGEGERVLQADAAKKKVSLKAGTKTVTTI